MSYSHGCIGNLARSASSARKNRSAAPVNPCSASMAQMEQQVQTLSKAVEAPTPVSWNPPENEIGTSVRSAAYFRGASHRFGPG